MTGLVRRKSITSDAVDELRSLVGLQGRDIANIFDVSPAAVSRWKKGETAPTIDKQTTLAQLLWVARQLSQFYESQDARVWLYSPHPQLDLAVPHELIRQGETARVLEVIERLADGVYL